LVLFLSVTAVGGGLGILLGWIPLPLEILPGSLFADYTIPGFSLLLIVSGLGMIATSALRRHSPLGLPASFLAGFSTMIFETVEIVVIGWHWLQGVYFAVGLLIAVLTVRLWMAEQRGQQRPWATLRPQRDG
jgi:hypothetical protein